MPHIPNCWGSLSVPRYSLAAFLGFTTSKGNEGKLGEEKGEGKRQEEGRGGEGCPSIWDWIRQWRRGVGRKKCKEEGLG